MTGVEEAAEAAWIEYRNDVQRRAPWENHRRAMRRLRRRDFVAGYLAAAAAQTAEAGQPAECRPRDTA